MATKPISWDLGAVDGDSPSPAPSETRTRGLRRPAVPFRVLHSVVVHAPHPASARRLELRTTRNDDGRTVYSVALVMPHKGNTGGDWYVAVNAHAIDNMIAALTDFRARVIALAGVEAVTNRPSAAEDR